MRQNNPDKTNHQIERTFWRHEWHHLSRWQFVFLQFLHISRSRQHQCQNCTKFPKAQKTEEIAVSFDAHFRVVKSSYTALRCRLCYVQNCILFRRICIFILHTRYYFPAYRTYFNRHGQKYYSACIMVYLLFKKELTGNMLMLHRGRTIWTVFNFQRSCYFLLKLKTNSVVWHLMRRKRGRQPHFILKLWLTEITLEAIANERVLNTLAEWWEFPDDWHSERRLLELEDPFQCWLWHTFIKSDSQMWTVSHTHHRDSLPSSAFFQWIFSSRRLWFSIKIFIQIFTMCALHLCPTCPLSTISHSHLSRFPFHASKREKKGINFNGDQNFSLCFCRLWRIGTNIQSLSAETNLYINQYLPINQSIIF